MSTVDRNSSEFREALELYQRAPLLELGALADATRHRLHPEPTVSYIIDRNINYTNVCNTGCSFCAFSQPDPAHPDSYVISRETLGQKIAEAIERGATRILLQGGHNDALPYDYYLELVGWIAEHYAIAINAFSASEIQQMSRISGKPYGVVLRELAAAG